MSFKYYRLNYVLPICELTRLIMKEFDSSIFFILSRGNCSIFYFEAILSIVSYEGIEFVSRVWIVIKKIMSTKSMKVGIKWCFYTRVGVEIYCYEIFGRVATYLVQVWRYMGYDGPIYQVYIFYISSDYL